MVKVDILALSMILWERIQYVTIKHDCQSSVFYRYPLWDWVSSLWSRFAKRFYQKGILDFIISFFFIYGTNYILLFFSLLIWWSTFIYFSMLNHLCILGITTFGHNELSFLHFLYILHDRPCLKNFAFMIMKNVVL